MRYEDMRADALAEMKHVLLRLNLSVGEGELRSIVERHSWENSDFPYKKGPGFKRRKAQPGGGGMT